MLTKHGIKVRKYALKIYYAFLQNDEPAEAIANKLINFSNVDKEKVEQAVRLVKDVDSKKEYYDEIISKYLRKGWTIDRLPFLDLIILRLSVHEMFNMKDIVMVINDYVSLASRYSEEKSSNYINGILDNIKKDFSLGKWK
ncbi:MAG: transcription antitermination factor NusB [Deferribacterales bacterium]